MGWGRGFHRAWRAPTVQRLGRRGRTGEGCGQAWKAPTSRPWEGISAQAQFGIRSAGTATNPHSQPMTHKSPCLDAPRSSILALVALSPPYLSADLVGRCMRAPLGAGRTTALDEKRIARRVGLRTGRSAAAAPDLRKRDGIPGSSGSEGDDGLRDTPGAMSQENVENVLTMWAASMEAVPAELDLSLLAENIVYEDDILPDHGSETYRGRDGIRRASARAIEPFEDAENVIEWTRDAGEHVVSCHRVRVTVRRAPSRSTSVTPTSGGSRGARSFT